MIQTRTLDPRDVKDLTIAGWTGRNRDAVEKHIHELEAIGVARPTSTPIFYRVSASLLTVSHSIEVMGDASSGEVEPVLVTLGGQLWVGVGSDHTDRKAETIGVTLSKQLCAKPVSSTLWRFADIKDRWDDIEIRSHINVDGERRLYQEGTLSTMRPPGELVVLGFGGQGLSEGSAMFCGTLPVRGGLQPSQRFEMEMRDPLTGETITAAYDVITLPVRG